MLIFPIEHLPRVIPVGVQTSKGVEEIGFNVSGWLDRWPDMRFEVWPTLPGESAAYPAVSELVGDVLVWHVNDCDTVTSGLGTVEVVGLAEGVRKPSGPCATEIKKTSLGVTQDPAEAGMPWYEKVMNAAQALQTTLTPTAPYTHLASDGEGKAVWAPLLAYPYTAQTVILPETGLTYVGEEAGGVPAHALMPALPGTVEVGKEYTVSYNGTAYTLTAAGLEQGLNDGTTVIMPVLGNGGPMGMEDTGEPFFLGVCPDAMAAEQGFYALCYALDGATSVTLSITGEGKAVHKLPREYYEQADLNAKWNEEGYVKGRGFWSVEVPGGEMVFDPAKVDEYESLDAGDGVVVYKISDIPLTKDTLDGRFGNAGIMAGASADTVVLLIKPEAYQNEEFMLTSVAPGGTMYGCLVATYDVGVVVTFGDVTISGLTPGTHFLSAVDTLPYISVVVNTVGKRLERQYSGIQNGSDTAKYLHWSDPLGWTAVTAETIQSELLTLTSPSGTKYRITVADDGTLTTTAV